MRSIKLTRGDVLSYSSGAASSNAYGFRIVRPGGDLLGLLRQRWPELFRDFEGRLPLFINAYPATIGASESAVFVDTYLNHGTGSRALTLASYEKMPAALVGQPLYLADLLLQHTALGNPMPDTLLLGMGGYTTPRSLEDFFRALCSEHGVKLSVFYGYGAAEVDAACLIAVRRNEQGELLYETRGPDVDITFRGTELLLARRDASGRRLAEPFATGDHGRVDVDGYVLWNQQRLAPAIAELLESWTFDDWRRRTGYLRHGDRLEVQLRQRVVPDSRSPYEIEFHRYARDCGHSWLMKPQWSTTLSRF